MQFNTVGTLQRRIVTNSTLNRFSASIRIDTTHTVATTRMGTYRIHGFDDEVFKRSNGINTQLLLHQTVRDRLVMC